MTRMAKRGALRLLSSMSAPRAAGPRTPRTIRGRVPRFLAKDLEDADRDIIRAGERTGRPLGSKRFVTQLEERLDRVLARRRPGPKAKEETSLWS